MRPPHVVVVGGGLAGLQAAVRCADDGARVTLLERRPRLGGATDSFDRHGVQVDNGQHVLLRCCEEYLGFLERLGVRDRVQVQPRLDIPVVDERGRCARLRRARLPAPLHLAGSLARYRHLRPAERLGAARAAVALRRLDPEDPALDATSFGHWLRAHGQSRHAIEVFWDLVVIATLNLPADEASLKLAVKVFRTGLLERADGADLGWPLVPLAALHAEPAGRVLDELGVDVRTGVRVQRVRPGGSPTVVCDDAAISCDGVVLATDWTAAQGLLPGHGVWEEIGASPIIDLHTVLDRRVTDLPLLAALGTPTLWIFDRSASLPPHRRRRGEQYLVASLSHAEGRADDRVEALRSWWWPRLGGHLPPARRANLVDFFVTRERAATFRQGPGSHALRPDVHAGGDGVVLAGAWTRTGWPATMEGAVRSGTCAAVALRRAMDARARTDARRRTDPGAASPAGVRTA